MPVFIFEVFQDNPPTKRGEADLMGPEARCVVLHDTAEEAFVSVQKYLPHARSISLKTEPVDPEKIAALRLVNGEPRLYE